MRKGPYNRVILFYPKPIWFVHGYWVNEEEFEVILNCFETQALIENSGELFTFWVWKRIEFLLISLFPYIPPSNWIWHPLTNRPLPSNDSKKEKKISYFCVFCYNYWVTFYWLHTLFCLVFFLNLAANCISLFENREVTCPLHIFTTELEISV